MNRLSCFGLALALGALATGCGGGDTVDPRASRLAIAPAALAELDLPGCDAVQARDVRRWEMFGHPHDAELVVLTADGCPVCVDTRDGAMRRAVQIDQPVTLESPPTADAAPDESRDPGDQGTGGDGGEEPSGTMNGGGTRTTTTGLFSKRGQISDDPLPPPGNGNPALAFAGRQ